jgi:hypothetical protein
MKLSSFDLKETVREVLEILQQKADAKSISLESNFENL